VRAKHRRRRACGGPRGHTVGRSLSVAVDAGYLTVGQDVDQRWADVLTVFDGIHNQGKASDTLSLKGALLGLSIAWRVPSLGDSFIRLGAGSFLGWVRDERSGDFETSTKLPYHVEQRQQQPADYGYLSLAVGVGFRPTSHLRLGAGLDAMAMVALRQPHWDSDCGQACRISGAREGESWFPNDALAGRFMMLVSPFVDAGFAF